MAEQPDTTGRQPAAEEGPHDLASRMAKDRLLLELTERGRIEVEHGYASKLDQPKP